MNETMISKHDMIDVDGVWLLKVDHRGFFRIVSVK